MLSRSVENCLKVALVAVCALTRPLPLCADDSQQAIGVQRKIGCLESPKKLKRISVDKAGVYENYLIDGEWYDGSLVKIRASDVTLRHWEIRNTHRAGIEVTGSHVTIENCLIHFCLAGSSIQPRAAFGIIGHPQHLTIRNCDIHYVSGDAVQFDPEKNRWDQVTIEN